MDVDKKSNQDESPKALDIGTILAQARKKKKLSSKDIAEQMNLAQPVIESIEANQFNHDLPPAFIRGYIRSYAQKVGADVKAICKEFDLQMGALEAPLQKINVVSGFKSTRKEYNSSYPLFRLLTFLIVIAVLGFGGWAVWKRVNVEKNQNLVTDEILIAEAENKEGANDTSELKLAGGEPQLEPETDGVMQETLDTAATSTTSSEETFSEEGAEQSDTLPIETASNENIATVNNTPVEEVEATVKEPLESSSVELQAESENLDYSTGSEVEVSGTLVSARFEFSGDCWVNITDATGEVLATGTKHDGKVMLLEGISPLLVVLGDPTVVNLKYNDEPYDLSRYRPGRSAHFVLE